MEARVAGVRKVRPSCWVEGSDDEPEEERLKVVVGWRVEGE